LNFKTDSFAFGIMIVYFYRLCCKWNTYYSFIKNESIWGYICNLDL